MGPVVRTANDLLQRGDESIEPGLDLVNRE